MFSSLFIAIVTNSLCPCKQLPSSFNAFSGYSTILMKANLTVEKKKKRVKKNLLNLRLVRHWRKNQVTNPKGEPVLQWKGIKTVTTSPQELKCFINVLLISSLGKEQSNPLTKMVSGFFEPASSDSKQHSFSSTFSFGISFSYRNGREIEQTCQLWSVILIIQNRYKRIKYKYVTKKKHTHTHIPSMKSPVELESSVVFRQLQWARPRDSLILLLSAIGLEANKKNKKNWVKEAKANHTLRKSRKFEEVKTNLIDLSL